MKLRSWSTFVVCLLLVAPAGLAAQADAPEEAREAAAAWLALVDGEDYAASWEAASRSFQSAVTAEAWAAQLAPLRAQVGAVEERELAHSQAMTDPPGAPAGEYVQLQYQSTVAVAGQVAENVIMVRDGDRGWRVAGYFVQPAG